MKRLLLVLPLLLLTACNDKQLETVKNVTSVMGLVADQVQSDTLSAYQLKLISAADFNKMMVIVSAVREAKTKTEAVVEHLKQLTPEARAQIWNILLPIGNAIRPEGLAFINDITDEKVRIGLFAGFSLLRTALTTAGAILLFT